MNTFYEITITPQCTKNRTVDGAIEETFRRLKEQIKRRLDACPGEDVVVGFGVKAKP